MSYPTYPPAPSRSTGTARSSADVLAAIILLGIYLVVAAGSVLFSLLFAMATDVCTSGRPCDTSGVGRAYLVTDGGAVAVFVTAVIMTIVALDKRWAIWWIPLVAACVQVLLTYLGATMAVAVV
ncbi:hypothetical protein [Gordonia hankookensis]|uniref:Uncharacterized protein n=1 Tax=Gordonia hankookensis TaxID=589403 RepID=A0ABR7WFM1_9ACTN|nr:hypothetical protein [Gordonia hankookensis]MBD1320534.1 hypothetical protein [Gordonia hankookensis]